MNNKIKGGEPPALESTLKKLIYLLVEFDRAAPTLLTTPYGIFDCGAFCEDICFCISPKNLLGDFFDSLSCTRYNRLI
jgi:hypothetical protein